LIDKVDGLDETAESKNGFEVIIHFNKVLHGNTLVNF
jgi:hypothetical protein